MYDDQMILESYFDSVMDISETVGEDGAEEFFLELIHYGATGERTHTFPWVAESTLRSLIPYIDNSRKNKKKALEKSRKVKESGDFTSDTGISEDESIKQ
ncbi:MAG: hypothetical protein ACI4XF_01530 [Oscillospiraceae bacterium]